MLAATDEGNEIIETKVNSPSLEYHSHVLTGSVPEDANELKAATEALEEESSRRRAAKVKADSGGCRVHRGLTLTLTLSPKPKPD